MKVFVIAFLFFGLAASERSGPYLPSGWKPNGPAFLLPGEVEKIETTEKEILQVEAEGSDFLREYGPPKDVSQDITLQALPETDTGKPFLVVNVNEEAEIEQVNSEAVNTEVATEVVAEKAGKSLDLEDETENASDFVAVEQEKIIEEEVSGAVEGVQNIADALANLESEIKAEQVQEAVEEKTVEINSGTLQQAPEGFLEYGPPGFREYGPPAPVSAKAAFVQEQTEEILNAVETNEARRRRFSPKFRTVRRIRNLRKN